MRNATSPADARAPVVGQGDLDRLVDGELNAEQRRALLRALDEAADGWKRCALAFLEAQVWRRATAVPSGDASRLDFAAASDSAIVSGLVYLALRVYSGRPATEILATEPDYVAAIGLGKHLSPTRSNGLDALLAFIRDHARKVR